MSITTELRAFILEDSTVAALIGTRMYCDELEQGSALPALVFGWAGGISFHHLTGTAGIAGPRVQFDAFAKTQLEAEAVLEALRLAIDGYRGDIGGSPPTYTIQGIFVEGQPRSLVIAGLETGSGSSANLRGRSVDYMVYYEEAI